MKRLLLPLFVIGTLILSIACSRTPDGIIRHGDMVDLLVDIHKAEAVISREGPQFHSDSMRSVIKQSIYALHNVNSAQVDSSLAWYGYHMEEYLSVYDDVINKLNKEITGSDAKALAKSQKMTVDSTDVWTGPKWLRINKRTPANSIVFDLKADESWHKGDNYQWQTKIVKPLKSGVSNVKVMMMAEYEDGKREYKTGSQGSDGWFNVRFVMDSTLTPIKLYGFVTLTDNNDTPIYLDSITMIRTRLNPSQYNRSGQIKF